MIKNRKTTKSILLVALIATAFSFSTTKSSAQAAIASELEALEGKIEATYLKVYALLEAYPEASYSFKADDGIITSVSVSGIDYQQHADMVETNLMEIEQMKREAQGLRKSEGTLVVTNRQPMPKNGYKALYNGLYRRIAYPENARDLGVEGTVIVKFLVDENGAVQQTSASEIIDTEAEWVVDDMMATAIAAVEATSGEWIPATEDGTAVPHYMAVPVSFAID